MERSVRRRFVCIGLFLIFLLVPASSHSDSKTKSDEDKIANTFIRDKAGRLYLIFKTGLYQSFSAKGDVWSEISSGTRQVVFDPGDVNVLYAITTKNLIQKSMDKGKSWLTIVSGLPDAEYSEIRIDPANHQNLSDCCPNRN